MLFALIKLKSTNLVKISAFVSLYLKGMELSSYLCLIKSKINIDSYLCSKDKIT